MTQAIGLIVYFLIIFVLIFLSLLAFKKASVSDGVWECFWYSVGILFLLLPMSLSSALNAVLRMIK